MPATEAMKDYAMLIAIALKIREPNYYNFDDTSEFISSHVEEFKALDSKTRTVAQKEAKALKYAVYDLESTKLAFYIGTWLSRKFKEKQEPFDLLDSLNECSRFKLAEEFWEKRLKEASGWKFIESIDGKRYSHDDIILFIAKDLDYRIAKSTAKFFFNLTERSAGGIIINPDSEPFNQVKFYFKETYHKLCNEHENVFISNDEHREYVKK